MAEIRMPKMGDGMEEGTILRWLKREGDVVALDEAIAEIETDKANVEVPAEAAGIITRIIVAEGQTVPVGTVIALVEEVGAADGKSTGAPPQEETAVAAPSVAETKERTGSAITPSVQPIEASAGEWIKASPLARKKAREMGIDLAMVQGTGPGGRIVERDIMTFVLKAPAVSAAGEKPAGETPAVARPMAAPAAPSLGGQDTEVSRMRRAIARRTVQSKQTIPHIYLVMPIDMEKAMNLLAELNEQTPQQKITVNDLIVKACAVALSRYPDVNVSYTPDDKIRRYDTIDIGIAVGTDNGLVIPVVPDCGAKTLRQIAAEARVLIEKARSGSLTPQEMSGGTFSTTNLGMFGIEEFSAIINPPESAILAIGAVTPEVVVDANGNFIARRRMRVTLSCDHRSVDGLLGAKFLQELKRLLESPLNLLA